MRQSSLTYLADEVAKLGEDALDGHVMGQDATHLSEEPASGVNVTNCAVVTLGGNHDQDLLVHSLLDGAHQLLVIDRQVSHSVRRQNHCVGALEHLFQNLVVREQGRHGDLRDVGVDPVEDLELALVVL